MMTMNRFTRAHSTHTQHEAPCKMTKQDPVSTHTRCRTQTLDISLNPKCNVHFIFSQCCSWSPGGIRAGWTAASQTNRRMIIYWCCAMCRVKNLLSGVISEQIRPQFKGRQQTCWVHFLRTRTGITTDLVSRSRFQRSLPQAHSVQTHYLVFVTVN